MIKAIIVATISACSATLIIALFVNIYKHRKSPKQMLGGLPCLPTHCKKWFVSKFNKKETEEEKEAREYYEKMSSDDPDIWKPLN